MSRPPVAVLGDQLEARGAIARARKRRGLDAEALRGLGDRLVAEVDGGR